MGKSHVGLRPIGVAGDTPSRSGRGSAGRAVDTAGGLGPALAGKGHNGDDASFAAEQLAERQPHLVRVSDPTTASREIEHILHRRPALIIDGLFGIGLNRSLASDWLKLIQRLNQARTPILAVDVPSGLNADTGEPLEAAIRAQHTITLGAVKQGLVKPASWPFVGRLHVAPDIGLIPYPFATELSWSVPDDFEDYPPARPVTGHKGSFGHLVILAGSLGYHGAAVLAARGAQRAQPGLVTLLTMKNVYGPVAAQLQSVMVRPWQAEFVLPESCTALAVGPGLAAEDLPPKLRQFVARHWAESRLPIVADASALAWLPESPCPPQAIRVMTPHPGEAARLLKLSAVRLLTDRLQLTRELSKRWGLCRVVLKGHQTLISHAKDELYLNSSGNPFLAQGGSGDLLTGYLGAAGATRSPG